MTYQEIEETNQTLQDIRNLMERSTKFISLSGLSGIVAGLLALIGSGFAHYYWGQELYEGNYYRLVFLPDGHLNYDFILFFLVDALLVLLLSIGFGIFFSVQKARRKGIKVWDKSAQRLLGNFLIPLITGGVFCLLLSYHGDFKWLASCTLMFYGLALLNAGKYTYPEIRILGLSEIFLGILGCIWLKYGLLFWTIGFGFLHIFYGFLMYKKYEK